MAKPSRMSRNRQKAPDGQWEMPEQSLSAALGQFVMAWSQLEASIEVAVAKQLDLSALDGSIVTAGPMFRGRAMMLLSLLNRDSKTNDAAIRVVKDMLNISDRNDIVHSVIGASKTTIWFNRRKTDNKFTSKIEYYDEERLLRSALRCSQLATALWHALKISKQDYIDFFSNSHNAANSV